MDSKVSTKPSFQIHINKPKKNNTKTNLPKKSEKVNFDSITFPVFTYHKASKFIKGELNNISRLLKHITNLNNQMHELSEKVDNDGMYLNLFINNSFNPSPKFHFSKHFLVMHKADIEIHDLLELDEAMIESEIKNIEIEDQSDLFDLIKSQNKYKANKEQIALCNKLYSQYMKHSDDYAELECRLESASDLYNLLIEKVKDELITLKPINLTTDMPAQVFSEEIHEIIAVHINDELAIFYTLVEYKDQFISFIQDQLK